MFLKKALLGYKEVEESEADYIAFYLEEGKQLLEDNDKKDFSIKVLKSEKNILESKKNELIEKINLSETQIVNLNNQIKNLMNEICDYRQKLQIEIAKNENFLRIAKERANADRGLTPKRKHHGYLKIYKENSNLIKSFIKKENIGMKTRSISYKKTLSIWKYNIQTPYLLELNSSISKEFIIKDLQEKFNLQIYDSFISSTSESEIKKILEGSYIFNFALTDNNKKYWCIKFQSGQEINF